MKYFILIVLIAATFYAGLQKAESVARKHAEQLETITLSHREEIAKLRRQYTDEIKGLNAQLDDHTRAIEQAKAEATTPAPAIVPAPPVPGVAASPKPETSNLKPETPPTGPSPAIRRAALTLSLEKATRELKEWTKKAAAEESDWENKTGIRQSNHDRQLRRDQVKAAIDAKQAEVDQLKSTLAGIE